jgi:NADPH:quinone reductase-like Zn-dependent oxidoreductase
MKTTMKAIVITQYGDPKVLEERSVARPEPMPGRVVVRVRAFGVNHAEAYFRKLAALPESYATAWVLLCHNLELRAGQTLLVRGGTSVLGQAAINLARLGGATVLATTRARDKFPIVEALGARPLLDEIVAAHELMESVTARGRIVIGVAASA